MTSFEPPTLDRLRKARVVQIETTAGPDRPVHTAAIWIVVDDAGRALIRSVRGARGRWYRELVANPEGAVLLRDERIPIRAEAAIDDERVAACSAAAIGSTGIRPRRCRCSRTTPCRRRWSSTPDRSGPRSVRPASGAA